MHIIIMYILIRYIIQSQYIIIHHQESQLSHQIHITIIMEQVYNQQLFVMMEHTTIVKGGVEYVQNMAV